MASDVPIISVLDKALSALESVFSSEVWEVRGQKFDLKDKKYEDQRDVLEVEDEKKIMDILHQMEKEKLWNEAELAFIKGLEDLNVYLPKRRIERILNKGKRRFNKRTKNQIT